MKKKNVEYQYPEHEGSSLQEPIVSYQQERQLQKNDIAVISEKELAENSMPLAESKRLLFERIRQDFHK